ncbi:MAG: PAS domain S-box protein [Planctomycetota bacterium]
MADTLSQSSAGVIDALSEAALVLDDHATVVAVNRRWRESPEGCFGITEAIEPGVNLVEAMRSVVDALGEEARKMLRGLEAVTRGGEDHYGLRFACHLEAEDSPRWMQVELRAYAEADGSRRVLMTRADATAEQRQNEALTQSESRYHAVVEQQLEMICRFQPDTLLTFVNQSYCDLFGKTREELIGRSFLELVPEEDWPGIHEHLAAFTAERPTCTYEHRVVMPDGTQAWQSWTDRAFFDEHGQVVEYQSVGRDITPYRKTQEALSESQTRFNQLADHLDSVFWIFDWRTRRMVYVNQAFESVFGRPAQALLDDPDVWIESVHPADRANVLSVFRAANRKSFDLTYRILRPDQTVRWVRDQGYPVHDEQGEVVRLVGITEDVTARVLAEQKVQHSEERYRAASEAGMDAFYLFDAVRNELNEIVDFVFVDLNQRGCDLVSRRREEIVGRRLCELLPVNRGEFFFGAYRDVVLTGKSLYREFSIDAAEEGILASWMEQQVVRVGDGIALTARDITDRKRNQQEITRQREENQKILDGIPAMVFYKDAHNRILRVNRAVCETLGLPADQIEGRHSAELFPDDADAFYADDLAVIKSGQPKLGYVERVGRTDDGERWVRTDKVPLYDSDHSPIGVIAITMDVTRLKRTTDRLEESEQRYRGLFDRVPVSVWEQDLSAVGEWLDGLRQQGIDDLPAYLDEHPEAINHAKRLQQVKGVNQATFDLMGAQDLESLSRLMRDPRLGPPPEPWLLKLEAIWKQQTSAEMETYCYTVDGRKLDVLFRLEIPEIDGRLDLSRAIVALTDISANRQRLFAQAQVTHAERERMILGHELHDTLAQQITGINMLTESLRRRLASRDIPEAERVAELAGLVGEANSEVRRIISGLSAERIQPDELETALESLAARLSLVHELPVSFHCPRTPDELSEEVANHLLFIAQEATHNAAKHAQAGSIEITLEQGEEALSLTVRDDGVGLPADGLPAPSAESGLGMRIMRFRAEAIRSTMEVSSRPREGTAVIVVRPNTPISAGIEQHRGAELPPGELNDD